jgi:hypothetical protein
MRWTERGWKRHAGLVGRLRERERELAAVEVLLEHRGGMLLVEGRAGIGKTSLVEVACSRADELGHEAAAGLLDRALAEPPPPEQRAVVLREAARAQVTAGWERAFVLLEEALRVAAGPRQRAEIALEAAESYAALFRWVDAVDVIELALAELGETDQELACRLGGELVVCGLHDARRARRVAPMLARLGSRRLEAASEPVAVAQAMALLLAGRPAGQIAGLLEETMSTCSASTTASTSPSA